MGPGESPNIRIIVPVFRALDITTRCLNALAASTLPPHASVQVIDDKSPEESLSDFCRGFCAQQGWEYQLNPENLGFVASANQGMSAAPDSDIILLNSDTRVHGDWVQRLQACIYGSDRNGTATPFSNNATICSYPVFNTANPLPEGWSDGDLDALVARANAGKYAELPTAVGFCMYIRRACLDEVGPFDEQAFGAGYGEECDFSMRARQSGWHNLLAADVFVYHEGSASFQGTTGERKAHADQRMLERYPEWGSLLETCLNEDPAAGLRAAIDNARLAERPGDATLLLREQRRAVASLRDRASQLTSRLDENAAEKQYLAGQLQECRDQFTATDRALAHADHVVGELREELEQQAPRIEAMEKTIAEQKQRVIELDAAVVELHAQIRLVEQSRSWRWTAWLRYDYSAWWRRLRG